MLPEHRRDGRPGAGSEHTKAVAEKKIVGDTSLAPIQFTIVSTTFALSGLFEKLHLFSENVPTPRLRSRHKRISTDNESGPLGISTFPTTRHRPSYSESISAFKSSSASAVLQYIDRARRGLFDRRARRSNKYRKEILFALCINPCNNAQRKQIVLEWQGETPFLLQYFGFIRRDLSLEMHLRRPESPRSGF